MPLPNGQIGVKNNPLKISPFIEPIEQGVNFAPPGSNFMITETTLNNIITESGDFIITE